MLGVDVAADVLRGTTPTDERHDEQGHHEDVIYIPFVLREHLVAVTPPEFQLPVTDGRNVEYDVVFQSGLERNVLLVLTNQMVLQNR